jgi:hypothetical protein
MTPMPIEGHITVPVHMRCFTSLEHDDVLSKLKKRQPLLDAAIGIMGERKMSHETSEGLASLRSCYSSRAAPLYPHTALNGTLHRLLPNDPANSPA